MVGPQKHSGVDRVMRPAGGTRGQVYTTSHFHNGGLQANHLLRLGASKTSKSTIPSRTSVNPEKARRNLLKMRDDEISPPTRSAVSNGIRWMLRSLAAGRNNPSYSNSSYRSLIRRIVRSETPAISAAGIQVIRFAIAFKITSCSFIIRSGSAAENFPGFVTLQIPAIPLDRTIHVLIRTGQLTC